MQGSNEDLGKTFIQQLTEVYPNKSEEELAAALETTDGSMEEAVLLLLEDEKQQPSTSSAVPIEKQSSSSRNSGVFSDDGMLQPSTSSPAAVEQQSSSSSNSGIFSDDGTLKIPVSESVDVILSSFSKDIINDSQDMKLEVKRDEVWCACLAFYKVALKHQERLNRNLFVKFIDSGENGIDAGALKNEFFSICLEEGRKRLFEGETSLIPRRSIGSKGVQFQVVGALIAHSVSQGGPGFPFLSEWVVNYLLDSETANLAINKDDIIKSEVTATLLEVIGKIDKAKNQEELTAVLEEDPQHDAYWQAINDSEWSSTEVITMNNKAFLIQELISNELVRRRKCQLDALQSGLNSLGFLALLRKYRKVAFHVLAYNTNKLNADKFMELVNAHPEGHAEKQSFEWFKEYVQASENVEDEDYPEGKLPTLLKFATGLWCIPPSQGENFALTVKFLEDDDTDVLPQATACANTLMLPTVHSSRVKFTESLDLALKFGHAGFAEY